MHRRLMQIPHLEMCQTSSDFGWTGEVTDFRRSEPPGGLGRPRCSAVSRRSHEQSCVFVEKRTRRRRQRQVPTSLTLPNSRLPAASRPSSQRLLYCVFFQDPSHHMRGLSPLFCAQRPFTSSIFLRVPWIVFPAVIT